MVEVILKQEIRKLGNRGDVVRVANGYARNFLFPKQMAMPATGANKRQLEEMRAAADRESARLKGDAQKLGEIIQGLAIELIERAGESDQLFGSVTSRDIASEIEKLGYTIDRHKIVITKPIRTVGEHEVTVHLHRDIDIPLKVTVLAEGREEGEEPSEVAASEGDAAAEGDTAAESDTAVEVSAEEPAAEADQADEES
jgi:large subunit ribosomal protein L9